MRIVSERLIYFKEKLEFGKLVTEEDKGTEELEQTLLEAIPSKADNPQADGLARIIYCDLSALAIYSLSLFSRKKLCLQSCIVHW